MIVDAWRESTRNEKGDRPTGPLSQVRFVVLLWGDLEGHRDRDLNRLRARLDRHRTGAALHVRRGLALAILERLRCSAVALADVDDPADRDSGGIRELTRPLLCILDRRRARLLRGRRQVLRIEVDAVDLVRASRDHLV